MAVPPLLDDMHLKATALFRRKCSLSKMMGAIKTKDNMKLQTCHFATKML